MNLRELPKPTTLEEAIKLCISYMSDADYAYVEENGAVSAHHGFGMAMRNEWGLWHDSPLNQHFKTRFGLGHADDMSGLILEGIDAAVKDQPFDIDGVVGKYKAHWQAAGIDPLTQERVA
jgi:hypothetical protein